MSGHETSEKPIILEVDNLSIAYKTRKGLVPAVKDVSFKIRQGETVGVAGESGCGKSTIAFAIVNFLGTNGLITGGRIVFEGRELVGRSQRELNRLRGDRISMVYQDPMAALNPSVNVGEQLSEVVVCHRKVSKTEAWERSIEMLDKVHMPDPQSVMTRYTHQLSGGQQQRIVIAMAMLNHPSLLIMDEPTTALDVTVEAAVLDIVEDLKSEYKTGILFISHNLGVVARVSDRLCVMYAGQLVERGPIVNIFNRPLHPYTIGLMRCVPRLGTDKAGSRLMPIRGRVPPPNKRPDDACVFAPRCDFADDACSASRPYLIQADEDHSVRCFHWEKLDRKIASALEKVPKSDIESAKMPRQNELLLNLENLKVYYEQESKSLKSLFGLEEPQYVKAVDDISLNVSRGKTLGIVGESGCGKSTLVKGIIGLEEITEGDMEFLSLDIAQPVIRRDMSVIRDIQMVFQNPDATLNPAFTVGSQIARPRKRFSKISAGDLREEVYRLLKAVRLGPSYYDRYPRQLSGGEKQRVGIARALASRPDLVICDEPVSALDVSVQAAVLNLLLEIQKVFGTTLIFIAHDLSVVRFFSDDVAVMYLGRIVEIGPAETIYAPPYHPYTEALLSAAPIPDPEAEQKHIRLEGNVPSALNPPDGCRFHTRCPRRDMLPDNGLICERRTPPWQMVSENHRILCHIPVETLMQIDSVIRKKAG